MTLRIGSLRIDPVARAFAVEAIRPFEPLVEGGPLPHPVVPRPKPRLLKQHDERGRLVPEPLDELAAEGLDRRMGRVMIEVKIVQEPRGLADAQKEEGMDPALSGIHYLHGVPRTEVGAERLAHF